MVSMPVSSMYINAYVVFANKMDALRAYNLVRGSPQLN